MKRTTNILLVTTAAISVACGGNTTRNTTEPETAKRVTAAIAVSRQIDQRAIFTATVEAQAVNNIAPQTPARIGKIYVEVGDRVRRGQRLVDMDSSNLTQAKVQLDNAEIEFRRVDELYRIGGESKSTWDARKLSYDIARTAYENLKENTTLVSPINGIVTARNYDSGDMHKAESPVLTVEQIRPVKLTINVSESYFSKLKKEMAVDVVADAFPDRHFTGHIHLIYPTVDPSTRTFPVEVRLPNADETVRPGMFARVTLSFGLSERVLVPDCAVVKQTGSGERYVYIIRDGVAMYSPVTIGQRVGDEFEILTGVSAGEVVVTTGQAHLRNGDKVEIVRQ